MEVFDLKEVVGWIEVSIDALPVRVSLCVNGEEVTGGWALPGEGLQGFGEIRHFRLELHDIWNYVKKADRMTVQVDGSPLPISGHGSFFSAPKEGNKPLHELKVQQEKGYVFGQTGRLQLSKTVDKAWQNGVLDLFHRVNSVLEEKFDYSAFFCYGTLLGAIREGNFIGHDLDFDCAYISSKRDGHAAKLELQQVAFALIESGFTITAKWSCIVVSDTKDRGVKLDLFHLFFDESDQIAFPFGVAGTSRYSPQDFESVRKIDFLGHVGHVPDNAEAFIEHVYGSTWRTPNPGFNWDRDRTARSMEGIFHRHQVEEIYWANFYAHATYDTQSTFSSYILNFEGVPQLILDIGCGDGRDSYAFANSGRKVVGLDRSHIAVRHANNKIAKLPAGHNVQFATCNAGDRAAVGEAIMKFREENNDALMLYYARFFLHSISEATQKTLFQTLHDCSRAGDMLAVEFRTDKDKDAQKVHGKHYRRFQNGEAFVKELESKFGFDVLVAQEGNGFSPYKGEDPHLLRVVAERGNR